jgi:nitrite reductase/ring-hydroxylating ferredoxin subunit/uncharacterized membrane protein
MVRPAAVASTTSASGRTGSASANFLARSLQGLVETIERQDSLDAVIEKLRKTAEPFMSSKKLRSALSGTPIGHPAHPVLVDLPIGLFTSAIVLDLTGLHHRKAARRLVGLGVLSALPAIVTGLSDWIDTDDAEARVGLVHASANSLAVSAFTMSWWARRRGGLAGKGWALAGAAVMTFGGWLGGHLAFGMGLGVNRNAFQSDPEEWTVAEGGLPTGSQPTCVAVDGVRVAVVATATGLAALADRCSHRGGPLSEGSKRENCLVCPWHGSAFDLDSGVPTEGPASVSQPTYETRFTDSGLELRRR